MVSMKTMMNLMMISFLHFIYIEIQCNMQFFTLKILIYISGIIGSTTFSQNDILTEYHKRNSLGLLPLDIYELRQKNSCFEEGQTKF